MARKPVRNPLGDWMARRTRGQWIGAGIALALLLLGYTYYDLCRDEPPPEDADLMAVEFPDPPDGQNGYARLEEVGKLVDGLEGDFITRQGYTSYEIFDEYDLTAPVDWDKAKPMLTFMSLGLDRVPEVFDYETLAMPKPLSFQVPIRGLHNVDTIFQHLSYRARFRAHLGEWDAAWQDITHILQLGKMLREGNLLFSGFHLGLRSIGLSSETIVVDLSGYAPDAITTRGRTDELNAFKMNAANEKRMLTSAYHILADRDELRALARETLPRDWATHPALYKPNATLRLFLKITRERIGNSDRLPVDMDFTEYDRMASNRPWVINAVGYSMVWNTGLGGRYQSFIRHASQSLLEVTRVALALAGYANEHGGALPATLEELAPAYIDAIPPDPMDGKPLRYDPATRKVWSIGHNLTDDGGHRDDDIMIEIPKR